MAAAKRSSVPKQVGWRRLVAGPLHESGWVQSGSGTLNSPHNRFWTDSVRSTV